MDQPFAQRLLDLLTGHSLTMMIGIGYRTGLFDRLAEGPATSAELAERADLAERYVREWLGSVTTGGLVELDGDRYTLSPDRAAALASVGASARMLGTLDTVLPQVVDGFADGSGVPYSAYARVAGDSMGEHWRRVYDEQLVDGFVGAVPGLTEQLTAGARVLDLGCGTGHAVAVLAAAFPASTFTGVDIAEEAITTARTTEPPRPNASYVVGDAADLAPEPAYDVVFAFDAIHDQRVPDVVLRRVRAALAPGGVFVMVDTKFSEDVTTNLANPFAPMSYAISLLFCVPLSLHAGGAALGAVWGTELAERMLRDAGFTEITLLDAPRPQNCIVVCR